MDEFEVNNAIKLIYSFIWNDFCDWYVEMIKNRLYADDEEIKSAVLTRAISIFEDALKMLHPFMPFITEELWQLMDERKVGESISTSAYPAVDEKLIKDSADEEMDFVKDIITAIRNIRGEMNIAPSKKVNALIKSSSVKDHQIEYIKKLAKVEDLQVDANIQKPKASASAVLRGVEIFIPLEGLIDLELERQKIQKEITDLKVHLQELKRNYLTKNLLQMLLLKLLKKKEQNKKIG